MMKSMGMLGAGMALALAATPGGGPGVDLVRQIMSRDIAPAPGFFDYGRGSSRGHSEGDTGFGSRVAKNRKAEKARRKARRAQRRRG